MKEQKLALLGGVPILKKPFTTYNSLGAEEKKAVIRVMDEGVISDFLGSAGEKFLGGKYVKEFENRICNLFKVKHAISFNSATTALQGAMGAIGIGPGDEVITSPYSMSATPSAILLNNAIPVFADIDQDNYCLDPKSVEKKITKRTKAIFLVNIFGGTGNFSKILSLAKRYKLKVVEDNAQAIGAKYKNKFLGTIGDAGVFSFNVHKNLQCGEGGVLSTNNDKIAFRAQLIRNHGEAVLDDNYYRNRKIFEPLVASNYRLSELHAAVAIEQLKKIKVLNGARVELANHLSFLLSKIDWLEPVKITPQSTHVYYFYPFKINNKAGIKRSTFVKAMIAEGFLVREGYVKPLYLLPVYEKKKIFINSQYPFVSKDFKTNVSYNKGICPVAEKLWEENLLITSICHYPRTKKDIDNFFKAILKIDKNRKALAFYEKQK